jgi:hypothetical protein
MILSSLLVIAHVLVGIILNNRVVVDATSTVLAVCVR